MTKRKPAKRRGRRAASSASTITQAHATTSPPRPTSPRSTLSRPVGPEPSTLPRLLTVDEVADLLRTTRKAVYGLVYRGALPGVIRLNRRLLIDQATLVQFLHESRGVSLTQQGDQR